MEDNPINREIATSLLRDAGFNVDEAEDGRVAVEKMSQGCAGFYDAVLMDVQMPVMNGYEATRTIRAMDIHGISDVPIIALSANAFESEVRDAKAAGMNDHVAKPINIRELMSVLANHLAKKEPQAADSTPPSPPDSHPPTLSSQLSTLNSPKELLAALSEIGCDVKGTIDKTFMGNEAFYVKMFGKLPSNTAPGRMRAALEAGDAKGMFEASHELKGVYASLGLSPLYDLCSEIVEIARAGSLEGTAELLAQLEEMHSEIVKLAS